MLDALIVGGDSLVGAALFRRLHGAGEDVVATTRRASPVSFPRMFSLDLRYPRPLPAARVTYLLAGVTNFRAIEENLYEAAQINVVGNLVVADSQFHKGGRVVFLSSSSAEHVPLYWHGKLKLMTEQCLRTALGDNVAIVRCGPIMMPGRDCYPDRDYQPIGLSALVDYLSAFMVNDWLSGLHKVWNGPHVFCGRERLAA